LCGYQKIRNILSGKEDGCREKKRQREEVNLDYFVLNHLTGHVFSVSLEEVTRLQRGQNTFPFERQKKFFGGADMTSFSLIYGDGRSLDLCCPTPDIFNIWFCGLKACLKNIEEDRNNMDVDIRFLKSKWNEFDINRNGFLPRKDIYRLVSSLNINRPTTSLDALFKQVDRQKNGTLDYEGFVKFMDLLRNRCVLSFLHILVNNFTPPMFPYLKPFFKSDRKSNIFGI